ncbi:hypothetical protein Tco_1556712 [Tanacetum coccineum]
MLATHMSLVLLMQVFQEDGSRGRPGLGEVYLLYIHGRVARKCISVGVGCDQQLPLGHPRCVPGRSGSYSTAKRDQKIKAKEKQIKNLAALLEAEADMKKAVEAKNAELVKEL